MNPAFDPYHLWLGIPPDEQPPNHYRLLGLRDRESDEEVIDIAALRLSAHVRGFLNSPHGETAKRLLAEMAAASTCLLDPARKAAYDATLPQLSPVEEVRDRWPERETSDESIPMIVPLGLEATSAKQGASAAAPRRSRDSGILQFAKIIGGGVLGLALGDLFIYLLTGNDLLGVLPTRSEQAEPAIVVAKVSDSLSPPPQDAKKLRETPPPEPFVPEPPANPPEQPVEAAEAVTANLVSPSPRRPPAEPPARLPAASPPAAPPPSERPEVLSGLADAWQLPPHVTFEARPIARLAREPDEAFDVSLRSHAARLPAAASIAIVPDVDGRAWTIALVNETKTPPEKVALAVFSREGAELTWAWASPPEQAEVRGQVANCQLELRHGASSRVVQLREVHASGQFVLDMKSDKQVAEFSLDDLPKTDRLRLEIRELVNFPEGASIRGGAAAIAMGKQAVVEFANLAGAEIRLRVPFTTATADLQLRADAVFRENNGREFDLTFERLDKFRAGVEREQGEDQRELPVRRTERTRISAELKNLAGQRPTAELQRAIGAARSALNRADSRIAALTRQIPQHQARLAAVPNIQAFLESLHQRAAIRYVILAECGERDIVLVEGTAPAASAD